MDGGSQTDPAPPKRPPEGVNVNEIVQRIGWPFPTWIEPHLYADEFHEPPAQALVNMFNDLGKKIDKALATTAGDVPAITFKYWRKISDKATKMKPAKLKATLYAHPDYGKPWMYVERA